MKKIKLLVFCLFISSSIFSIFESSPWVILSNQTPFDLDCQIQVTCCRAIDKKKPSSFKTKNNQNINIDYQSIVDENGKRSVFFNLNINCKATTTIYLDELFTIEDGWIDPTIESVVFLQKSLQLIFFEKTTGVDDRYFCATYEPYVGIIITTQPIPIYLKCFYKLQDMVSTAVGVIGYMTKWRP